jgi:hypothetical protein
MTRLTLFGVVVPFLLAAACNTPPPRPWLRYQPAGPTDLTTDASGLLVARMHGADVTVDLGRRQTRVEVVVHNGSKAPVEVRMGPDAGAPRNAIGEMLLRPIDGTGAAGPDYAPYSGMQPVVVEAGWRGTFYLDAPLGREPVQGQYFVLAVEARDASGKAERRTLPLIAKNAGTMPADGQ